MVLSRRSLIACSLCDAIVPVTEAGSHIENEHMSPNSVGWLCACGHQTGTRSGIATHCLITGHPTSGLTWDETPFLRCLHSILNRPTHHIKEAKRAETPPKDYPAPPELTDSEFLDLTTNACLPADEISPVNESLPAPYDEEQSTLLQSAIKLRQPPTPVKEYYTPADTDDTEQMDLACDDVSLETNKNSIEENSIAQYTHIPETEAVGHHPFTQKGSTEQVHPADLPLTLDCLHCGSRVTVRCASRAHHLLTHVLSRRYGVFRDPAYACSHCPSRFTAAQSLRRHLNQKHKGEGRCRKEADSAAIFTTLNRSFPSMVDIMTPVITRYMSEFVAV